MPPIQLACQPTTRELAHAPPIHANASEPLHPHTQISATFAADQPPGYLVTKEYSWTQTIRVTSPDGARRRISLARDGSCANAVPRCSEPRQHPPFPLPPHAGEMLVCDLPSIVLSDDNTPIQGKWAHGTLLYSAGCGGMRVWSPD